MELRDGGRRLAGAVAVMSILTLAFASSAGAAQAPVNLGTTASYAVLAATTVTNTGPTLVNGNLGLSPGSAVTGFPPGLVAGGVAERGQRAGGASAVGLVTAYNDAAGRTPATTVLGDSLGGLTLVAGLYSGGALDLTGPLTLDAQGDPGAVFIFQTASTLITASASRVLDDQRRSAVQRLLAGRKLGDAGHYHDLQGDDPRPHVDRAEDRRHGGRPALARNGAVTLDDNTIGASDCAPAPPVRTATTTVTQVHNPTHADITNGSAAAGTAVHDSAVVTGAAPTGTVTYRFYAAGNGSLQRRFD